MRLTSLVREVVKLPLNRSGLSVETRSLARSCQKTPPTMPGIVTASICLFGVRQKHNFNLLLRMRRKFQPDFA
jgi:hypothetical protein